MQFIKSLCSINFITKFKFFSVFLFVALFSTSSLAQPRDLYTFKIIKGEVTVTPAFCFPGPCVTTTAELKGNFDGFLPGGGTQLFFPRSDVTTTPNVFFDLPQDPNESSGGTVRDASFRFDGTLLEVKGRIDQRAFDGPLIEYVFEATGERPSQNAISYFTARPDFRKCVSPLCGGYFVKAVNRGKTTCADGTKQKECYVAELSQPLRQSSVAGFANKTPFLFVGKITPKEYKGFGNLGVFDLKSAYRSAADKTAKGVFFGLTNNGIVCITSPCFSFDLRVLNRSAERMVSRYDLEKSGASREDIERANTLLAEGGELLLAGYKRRYEGFAGTGIEVRANQFYLPIPLALSPCEEGYAFNDGACRTPYGCKFPELELTGVGGAAMVDPITGEVTSSITKSCVERCEFPAFLEAPGQCKVFFP